MMTSAQDVEMSVTTTDNSPSQDYTHLDDQTTLLQNKLTQSLQVIPHCKSTNMLLNRVTININYWVLLSEGDGVGL